MRAINRKHLILSAAGAGLAASGLATPTRGLAATAPSDGDLAFANFSLAAEFLLQDFYAKVASAQLFAGSSGREILRGKLNADEHVAALTKLLTSAGQTAAVRDDFDFAWPDTTFATKKDAQTTGLTIVETLLGVYLRAAAAISIPSYRGLFASMAANLAQQVAAFSQFSGRRVVGISFAPAIEVKDASDTLEAYLG